MDASWHEAWIYTEKISEIERNTAQEKLVDDIGVYVSCDLTGHPVRIGTSEHIHTTVRSLDGWENEVNWYIFTPVRTGEDGVRDIKCFKQQVKRAKDGKKWYRY
jgi:hypothetical protein